MCHNSLLCRMGEEAMGHMVTIVLCIVLLRSRVGKQRIMLLMRRGKSKTGLRLRLVSVGQVLIEK